MAETCPGCGAVFPAVARQGDVPVEASPSCWQHYLALADECAGRSRHWIGADAYALQHPGERASLDAQSYWLHLVPLHLLCEDNRSPGEIERAIRLMRWAAPDRLSWLEAPAWRGGMTVADVAAIPAGEARNEAIVTWAEHVWAAWSKYHEAVRLLVADLGFEREQAAGG